MGMSYFDDHMNTHVMTHVQLHEKIEVPPIVFSWHAALAINLICRDVSQTRRESHSSENVLKRVSETLYMLYRDNMDEYVMLLCQAILNHLEKWDVTWNVNDGSNVVYVLYWIGERARIIRLVIQHMIVVFVMTCENFFSEIVGQQLTTLCTSATLWIRVNLERDSRSW